VELTLDKPALTVKYDADSMSPSTTFVMPEAHGWDEILMQPRLKSKTVSVPTRYARMLSLRLLRPGTRLEDLRAAYRIQANNVQYMTHGFKLRTDLLADDGYWICAAIWAYYHEYISHSPQSQTKWYHELLQGNLAKLSSTLKLDIKINETLQQVVSQLHSQIGFEGPRPRVNVDKHVNTCTLMWHNRPLTSSFQQSHTALVGDLLTGVINSVFGSRYIQTPIKQDTNELVLRNLSRYNHPVARQLAAGNWTRLGKQSYKNLINGLEPLVGELTRSEISWEDTLELCRSMSHTLMLLHATSRWHSNLADLYSQLDSLDQFNREDQAKLKLASDMLCSLQSSMSNDECQAIEASVIELFPTLKAPDNKIKPSRNWEGKVVALHWLGSNGDFQPFNQLGRLLRQQGAYVKIIGPSECSKDTSANEYIGVNWSISDVLGRYRDLMSNILNGDEFIQKYCEINCITDYPLVNANLHISAEIAIQGMATAILNNEPLLVFNPMPYGLVSEGATVLDKIFNKISRNLLVSMSKTKLNAWSQQVSPKLIDMASTLMSLDSTRITSIPIEPKADTLWLPSLAGTKSYGRDASSSGRHLYVTMGSMQQLLTDKDLKSIMDASKKFSEVLKVGIIYVGGSSRWLAIDQTVTTWENVKYDTCVGYVLCHGGAGTLASIWNGNATAIVWPVAFDQPYWCNYHNEHLYHYHRLPKSFTAEHIRPLRRPAIQSTMRNFIDGWNDLVDTNKLEWPKMSVLVDNALITLDGQIETTTLTLTNDAVIQAPSTKVMYDNATDGRYNGTCVIDSILHAIGLTTIEGKNQWIRNALALENVHATQRINDSAVSYDTGVHYAALCGLNYAEIDTIGVCRLRITNNSSKYVLLKTTKTHASLVGVYSVNEAIVIRHVQRQQTPAGRSGLYLDPCEHAKYTISGLETTNHHHFNGDSVNVTNFMAKNFMDMSLPAMKYFTTPKRAHEVNKARGNWSILTGTVHDTELEHVYAFDVNKMPIRGPKSGQYIWVNNNTTQYCEGLILKSSVNRCYIISRHRPLGQIVNANISCIRRTTTTRTSNAAMMVLDEAARGEMARHDISLSLWSGGNISSIEQLFCYSYNFIPHHWDTTNTRLQDMQSILRSIDGQPLHNKFTQYITGTSVANVGMCKDAEQIIVYSDVVVNGESIHPLSGVTADTNLATIPFDNKLMQLIQFVWKDFWRENKTGGPGDIVVDEQFTVTGGQITLTESTTVPEQLRNKIALPIFDNISLLEQASLIKRNQVEQPGNKYKLINTAIGRQALYVHNGAWLVQVNEESAIIDYSPGLMHSTDFIGRTWATIGVMEQADLTFVVQGHETEIYTGDIVVCTDDKQLRMAVLEFACNKQFQRIGGYMSHIDCDGVVHSHGKDYCMDMTCATLVVNTNTGLEYFEVKTEGEGLTLNLLNTNECYIVTGCGKKIFIVPTAMEKIIASIATPHTSNLIVEANGLVNYYFYEPRLWQTACINGVFDNVDIISGHTKKVAGYTIDDDSLQREQLTEAGSISTANMHRTNSGTLVPKHINICNQVALIVDAQPTGKPVALHYMSTSKPLIGYCNIYLLPIMQYIDQSIVIKINLGQQADIKAYMIAVSMICYTTTRRKLLIVDEDTEEAMRDIDWVSGVANMSEEWLTKNALFNGIKAWGGYNLELKNDFDYWYMVFGSSTKAVNDWLRQSSMIKVVNTNHPVDNEVQHATDRNTLLCSGYGALNDMWANQPYKKVDRLPYILNSNQQININRNIPSHILSLFATMKRVVNEDSVDTWLSTTTVRAGSMCVKKELNNDFWFDVNSEYANIINYVNKEQWELGRDIFASQTNISELEQNNLIANDQIDINQVTQDQYNQLIADVNSRVGRMGADCIPKIHKVDANSWYIKNLNAVITQPVRGRAYWFEAEPMVVIEETKQPKDYEKAVTFMQEDTKPTKPKSSAIGIPDGPGKAYLLKNHKNLFVDHVALNQRRQHLIDQLIKNREYDMQLNLTEG